MKVTSGDYVATIGLEIHAELNTKSKMFCGCDNYSPPGTEPNINTCEVCTAQPGVLPVMNEEAVAATVQVGLALGMQIAPLTKWDRKQYFYPDLPKGYQISQYDLPMTSKGKLLLSNGREIEITRVHLEEDTGKLTHVDKHTTLVDFNRAGTPLMELVTEPVIENSSEAKEFAKSYQSILRALGISNADMDKGEMRVEANVSVMKKDATEFGTKVEVKNINSFKAVERAIEFEIKRQIEVLEEGGEILQETRGWSEPKQKTFSQRIKETAADYRYFPEPDLTELEVEDEYINKLREALPELPAEKKLRYIDKYNLAENTAGMLSIDLELSKFFEELIEAGVDGQSAGLFTTNELVGLLNAHKKYLTNIEAGFVAEVLKKKNEGKLTTPQAKALIDEYVATGESKEISEGESVNIEEAAKKVIAANPSPVEEYLKGKESVLQFLVGQVMRETKGQADPGKAAEALRRAIK